MTSSARRSTISSTIGSGSLWNMTQHLSVTTFIGAGGKTTCLRSLSHEIASAGLQVVATTTTKVYPEEHMHAWRNLNPPPKQKGAWFWYDKLEDESGKWLGPSVTAVDNAISKDILSFDLHNLKGHRFWVIEGDGARERKLKCWESYEPQIPKYTDCAVLVLDRGLWGDVLQEDHVHRSHRCKDLLGQVWKAESAWRYFLRSPVFAPQYEQMSWVILLNGPGKTIENKKVIDPMDSLDLLHDLKHKWLETQQNAVAIEARPSHLRLAVGDAKEGDLRWFDLW
ncbi:selenium cofactor biosynthesis protein YqeC [Desulfosporosinus nitroreducens]|uniref:Selenium cofactor biosynthesis protein YqeC n=1 Tax=Desulfosporosinus nitroreducens TaxID=2018668 RepID=A0ABT8QMK2_9FIRM|nr:selenium cofactor biosynthesis protein YqeC [Desulfosporosinus nitroreducens]MDO0822563.1 selenium cofactor biosynthesis protein YqeC [Desulfosporosinus nitroreducens]